MTSTVLQTNRPKQASVSSDRFEKWIQGPLPEYGSAYIGDEWRLYLSQSVTVTSASATTANQLPVSLTPVFEAIAAEQEERRLLSDWLAISSDAFSFWDNDADAEYDNL